MLVVKAQDIEKLHKALTDLKDGRALAHAARQGLTTSAKATSREWELQGRRTMTVRNKWTFGKKFHKVVKARVARRIIDMEAVAGSKHKYMREQEFGVSRFALWRKGVPIPTVASRVGASKKRLQSTTFWRRKIKLGRRLKPSNPAFAMQSGSSAKTRKQRYMAASMQLARRQGRRFVYLDLGSWGKGIFDVSLKRKVKKVWNLNRRSTYTKPNPMLQRSMREMKKFYPQFHRMALEEQVRFVKHKRGIT